MEDRKSIPPVPPMSGDVLKAKTEAAKPKAKPILSAAKASKAAPAKAKRAPVATRTDAKGRALRCMVMVNRTHQCSNPGRHPHGKAFTCSTHDRSIAAGVTLVLTGKPNLLYIAPHTAPTAA